MTTDTLDRPGMIYFCHSLIEALPDTGRTNCDTTNMTGENILFLLLALLSEVVGTVSGFGSSILFVPVASLFFDLRTVLALTAVFHVFSNIAKMALFRSAIDKRIAIRLGIPAIIGVIIGAYLTTLVKISSMSFILDIVLVCLAIYLIMNFDKKLTPSVGNLVVGGSASGFMAGFVGTGGAIRGIVLAAFGLPKEVYITTSALIDLGVDLSRSIIYVRSGYFPPTLLFLIPFLVAISFLGGYLGKVLLRYVSEKQFRYLTLGVIIASSLIHLIKYLLSDTGP